MNKDDTHWRECMNNTLVFDKCYKIYEGNRLYKPINKNAVKVMNATGAKNFIDLAVNHKTRDIPDFQVEHALERYLGYLICHEKNVLLAE